MSKYSKVHLSYVEQVLLLRSRGLTIPDKEEAARALERYGYYRLAGYWVPFRDNRTGYFTPDASFEDVLDIYEYDKMLRLLVLAALERIEITTRVRIAHLLGQRHAFALEQTDLLERRFVTGGYATWRRKYEHSLKNTSDKFVMDFLNTYGHPLPVWLGIELWDFGMLSSFYRGMKFKDRNAVAASLNLEDGRVMKSWLHSLSVTRNICAHHARFWNRTLARPMVLPTGTYAPQLDHLRQLSPVNSRRQYPILCSIAYALDQIEPGNQWKQDLIDHILNFPHATAISLGEMGFPPDWTSQSLWNN